MNKAKKMDSCTELFKAMNTLPLYSQYIFPLSLYAVNNKHLFTSNSAVHKHDAGSANNFHLPVINLTTRRIRKVKIQRS
jgi:hypothetical protein